jgi:hypothetical protein
MTNKEVQRMLDSFQKEVTKKDWEIDRDIQAQSMGKEWGPVQGKKNVESGLLSECQVMGGKVMGNIAKDNWLPDARIDGGKNSHLVQHTCPHCGYSDGGPNIFKSHFDNCVGLLDVFEFHKVGRGGEVGKLVGTYNNQTDIINDFPTMSKPVLCQAVNGNKKAYHPHFVGGYVVIPRGIEN